MCSFIVIATLLQYRCGLILLNTTAKFVCTQIRQTEGPIGRIFVAVFAGENFVMATETGFVSAVLNAPKG